MARGGTSTPVGHGHPICTRLQSIPETATWALYTCAIQYARHVAIIICTCVPFLCVINVECTSLARGEGEETMPARVAGRGACWQGWLLIYAGGRQWCRPKGAGNEGDPGVGLVST
jgi:hypothetical protein